MGGSNQLLNMGSSMTGFTHCGQNMPTGQPGNSPSLQDGSNQFLNQMSSPNMYQPQMPMPQEKTGLSNEKYQQYVSKCLISFMLNKVQHMQEHMKMQFFMQHPFMQNFQNNTSQNQPGGFSGTQTQMNTKVNEKDDKSSGKSPMKKKQAPQKKSSNHGKLVFKNIC